MSDNELKATGNDTAQKLQSCELQESQGLEADFDTISGTLKNERFEPQIIIKNQEVTSENVTSVLSGWQGSSERERKSAQIISMFVSHHDEILAMKEQVQMIRGLLAA